jgi:hypothetical protein
LSSSRDETDNALTQRWSWLEEWVGFQPFDKEWCGTGNIQA